MVNRAGQGIAQDLRSEKRRPTWISFGKRPGLYQFLVFQTIKDATFCWSPAFFWMVQPTRQCPLLTKLVLKPHE